MWTGEDDSADPLDPILERGCGTYNFVRPI